MGTGRCRRDVDVQVDVQVDVAVGIRWRSDDYKAST